MSSKVASVVVGRRGDQVCFFWIGEKVALGYGRDRANEASDREVAGTGWKQI